MKDFVIRTFDILFSLLTLLILSPLFFIIGILIVIDSPGRVLFLQKRVGKSGKIFKILKFRTMVPPSIGKEPLYRKNSKGEAEPVIKKKNDERITKIGRFLRKYSLDELPQLVNIILGDMSLVGPRPPVPEEVDAYEIHHKNRLLGRPGLTGLAQIKGRTDMDFDEIVKHDVHFIENRSIWLYLKILILTIPAVLTGKSAY